MRPNQPIPRHLNSVQIGVLVVAAVGIAISAIAALTDTSHFLRVYLVGFVLWTEAALGCLGLIMLNNLVDARWLAAIQRFAEAGARTLPLLALLFIPVALGLGEIYPWVNEPELLEGGNAALLQPAFFIIRTFVYFLIWSLFAYQLTQISYATDEAETATRSERARNWSAIGAVVLVLTSTLAAVDWTMALAPEWFSSIYGWLSLSRAGLTFFALALLGLALVWNTAPMSRFVNERVEGDLGAMLLVTLLVWIYMNGIQFIVIWAGNVTYFASFYTIRLEEGWVGLTSAIVLIHAVLLIILLLPGLKRIRAVIVGVALALVIMRFVELYWVVLPTYTEAASVQWFDLGPFLAIGGVWLGATLWVLKQHPLLPVHHPVYDNAQMDHADPAEAI